MKSKAIAIYPGKVIYDGYSYTVPEVLEMVDKLGAGADQLIEKNKTILATLQNNQRMVKFVVSETDRLIDATEKAQGRF